jgi:hypothetical protein
MPEAASGAVRYFIVVLFSCLLWPMCFKGLCRLYIKIDPENGDSR